MRIIQVNKRGVTLIQMFFAITIIIALSALTFSNVFSIGENRAEAEIESNKSQLESVVKSYLFTNNTLPTKESIILGDFAQNSPKYKFFKAFEKEGTLTGTEVNKRFKIIDVGRLTAEGYLSAGIEDEDNYLVDKNTAKVLYVGDKNTSKFSMTALVDSLIKEGGDAFKLKRAGKFEIKTETTAMAKVNKTLTVDKKVVVGGKGTMTLAVMVMDNEKGMLFKDIKDLTDKLSGSGAKTVTDLRYLGDNKILVHYHNGEKLAYETVSIK